MSAMGGFGTIEIPVMVIRHYLFRYGRGTDCCTRLRVAHLGRQSRQYVYARMETEEIETVARLLASD